MEQLAKDLQDFLKAFNGCTVETTPSALHVYPAKDVATPLFAELIFEFAFINSLLYYIGVSIQGHLRFVLFRQ